MSKNILLQIEPDNKFPYLCLTEYNIRLYGNSQSRESQAQKLRHIESQFLLTQKANYRPIEINKTFELIEDFLDEDHFSTHLDNYFSYYFCNYKDFFRDIQNRLNIVNKRKK